MDFKFDKNFAQSLDNNDPLKDFRNEFLFPQHEGREVVYFTGNSLGLQPKGASQALQQELNDWEKYGVEGHFEAQNPWFSYHEMFAEPLAKLVGAKPTEVVAMNGLTTNLHLMMISFYQPTKTRYKIICEAKAFPSDQYALESQAKLHGLNPEDALIEIAPRQGEHLIRTEDIMTAIEQAGDSLALVMIGGVNYYTGQVFEMEKITAAGHAVGANVGWDLAHGAGNIPLKLHDWNVDFACWCSYKYLNSGPGSVSGVFVHEKHCNNTELIRLAGWWGHDKKTRFLMEKGFQPMKTAEAWQLSNAPVLAMAVHKVALNLHNKAGIENLRKKSIQLTNYLEFVIQHVSNQHPNSSFEIITPKSENERGCQLSILAHGHGKSLFEAISKRGVIADWREPNVIRIAPVPIYNSFEDCYRFGEILSSAIEQGK
jgi:kynureninase